MTLNQHEGSTEPADEALFAVHFGFSRAPLKRIVRMLLELAWVLLLAAVLGLPLAIQASSAATPIFIGMALLVMIYRLHRLRQIDRGSFWFFGDRFEVDWQLLRGARLRRLVRYRDLGELSLSQGELLGFAFGAESSRTADTLAIPIERRTAEDVFDHLVEHLEQHLPDHSISVVESGQVRYTQPWQVATRYPDQEPVTATSWLPSAGGDHVDSRLALDRDRVLDRQGFTVATVAGTPPGSVTIELGDELEWEYRPAQDHQLFERDAPVGQARFEDGGVSLEFSRPVHPLWAAALLLVIRSARPRSR